MASLFGLEGLGKDQAEMLDLLDVVQQAGVGDGILPQIVAVGDQSSGKSSVLTRLTGIEFPRSQYACTKFATEIRLRRTGEQPDDRICAWILPDRTVARSDAQLQALEAFKQDLVETPENIARVMQDATNLIAPPPSTTGVTTANNNHGASRGPKFSSKDKLIIQKTGPKLPALTLVDLPGLVTNDNDKQSAEDLRLIEELTDSYIKDPASIILAVVSGAQQFSQARILKKVTIWDPSGTRTIGLLTKPDVADRECYTDEFIRLMTRRDANTQYHFRLGWHVLLNPDAFSKNPSQSERNAREAQYWLGSKWSKLPQAMRGADALRARLGRQLQREIARHLPAIQERLQQREEHCETALSRLGRELLTEKDKAKELGRLFGLSHQLIQQAVYGHLVNPPRVRFFPDKFDPRGIPAQHLRARAVDESDKFEERFRELGLRCRFTDREGKVDVKAKREFAKKVVEPLLPQIRGRELPGDPNTRAPYMVFKRYSKDWLSMAKAYERKIESACGAFLGELKEGAWPSRMREPLEANHLRKRFEELLNAARAELEQINHETFALEIQPFDREYEKCVREAGNGGNSEGERQVMTDAERVVEQMLAYYKLAERIYIRNVIYQVAERHLLAGMMKLFDTSEVMGMNDETIDKITLEDPDTQKKRRDLEQEKERIEEARRRCDIVAARTSSRLDADTLPGGAVGEDEYNDDATSAYQNEGDFPAMNGVARSDDGDSGNEHLHGPVGEAKKVEEDVEVDRNKTAASGEQQFRDRIEHERLEEQRLENHEDQRLEQQRLDDQRLEEQRIEAQRIEQRRIEQQRLEEQRLEEQRLEEQRMEQQRLELLWLEEQRLEQQRLEQQRLEEQRLEEQREKWLEGERLKQQRIEADRIQQQRKRQAEEETRRQREEQERVERDRRDEKRRQEQKEEEARLAAEAALEQLEAQQREARRLDDERREEEDRQARLLEVERREMEYRRAETVDAELREARRAERRKRRIEKAKQDEDRRLRTVAVNSNQLEQVQSTANPPQRLGESDMGQVLQMQDGVYITQAGSELVTSSGFVPASPRQWPFMPSTSPLQTTSHLAYQGRLQQEEQYPSSSFYGHFEDPYASTKIPGQFPDDHEAEEYPLPVQTPSVSRIIEQHHNTMENTSMPMQAQAVPPQLPAGGLAQPGPYFNRTSASAQSQGSVPVNNSPGASTNYRDQPSGMSRLSGSGSSTSSKKKSSGLGRLFGSRR